MLLQAKASKTVDDCMADGGETRETGRRKPTPLPDAIVQAKERFGIVVEESRR